MRENTEAGCDSHSPVARRVVSDFLAESDSHRIDKAALSAPFTAISTLLAHGAAIALPTTFKLLCRGSRRLKGQGCYKAKGEEERGRESCDNAKANGVKTAEQTLLRTAAPTMCLLVAVRLKCTIRTVIHVYAIRLSHQ